MTSNTEVIRRASWSSRVELIVTLAVSSVKARFGATGIGLIWMLIVPVATVVIYSAVFSLVFRAVPPPMGSGEGVYAAWLFCGLVAWNLFAQPSAAALASIVIMGPMLQKVYIPSFVPPVSAALGTTMEKAVESLVMLGVFALLGNVAWTWLLFPLVFVAIALFATSFGYIMAVTHVFFRDLSYIYGIAIQMLFFLTPVIYTPDMIPESWNGIPVRAILALNPMTGFVDITRSLVYELTLPELGTVAYCSAWVVAMAGLAVVVYRKWGRDVAEAI